MVLPVEMNTWQGQRATPAYQANQATGTLELGKTSYTWHGQGATPAYQANQAAPELNNTSVV